VMEHEPLAWNGTDFNAYTRSKKLGEHMVRELMSEVPCLYLRPSSVIGDSRFGETTQFDMLRAICALSEWPVLPFDPRTRIDIVNADWAGHGIAELHLREDLAHDTYHLSAGTESRTIGEIAAAISAGLGKRMPRFAGRLASPLTRVSDLLARAQTGGPLQRVAALWSGFIPYVNTDIVYDNAHTLAALGTSPTPFTYYGATSCAFGKSVNFEFPYRALPEVLDLSNVPPAPLRPVA
jgi:nucleoside-diphosphate-sugar epimerase